jgi:hypothetical protein
MKRLAVCVLLLAVFASGCSLAEIIPVSCDHLVWEQHPTALYSDNDWEYVCKDNGYVAVEINEYGTEPWNVFANGSGYGEYRTFEQAKARGEEVIAKHYERSK